MVELFHHRWALPLLAELQKSGGAKFVTLAYRLGASQGALRPVLRRLLEMGLVVRNEGYGHPLRPEYFASNAGLKVGRAADNLLAELHVLGLAKIGLRKWPMPALLVIGSGRLRFTDIKERLATISDRALSGALKQLEEATLVERSVIEAYPPAPLYVCTYLARPLLVQLDTLATLCTPARRGRVDSSP